MPLPLPRLLSCLALGAVLSLASSAAHADKVVASSDLPKNERERLQLAADAMTQDRPKGDLEGARKKLEKALKSCNTDKTCAVDAKAHLELFYGAVLADLGKNKEAEAAFERALKLDPKLELGGSVSSTAAETAFLAARARVLPNAAAPTPAPAPAPVAAAPSDAGLQQPAGSDLEIKALQEIGGAKWKPGLGLVSGEGKGKSFGSGEAKQVEVPGFDQSTWFDDLMGEASPHIGFGFPFNHYDFAWQNSARQDTLGGLGFELRLGIGLPIEEAFIPYLDTQIGFGKAGNAPNFLLFSGGEYEIWNVEYELRLGFDLEVGWAMLGGYAGGFVDYYSPSVEFAGEPADSGADLGPFYGAHLRLGSEIFVLAAYTWKAGRLETARVRRLEIGGRPEDGDGLTWAFYWEERETPDAAAATDSMEERVLQRHPIERTIGLEFRTF
jgi:tetratricopeptide (TPR) repeat protein